MDPIKFVEDNPETILREVIRDIESIMGRSLGNADPEMLLANVFAYREVLLRKQLNYTGNQNLISFASGASLEQIGMKSGTYRLPATKAVVAITFTMAAGAPTVTIPAGTRVKSGDGAVMFSTDSATVVASGTATIDIDCTCTVAGVIGNGYIAGLVSNIVDPVAYVSAAANIDTTSGGADAETDDQLRARIPLSYSTYSVAGPEDAYKFYTKSVSSSIADVKTQCAPIAGAINEHSLYDGGTGYAVGDVITVDGGTTPAKIQVTSVDLSGTILTYKLLSKGFGYSAVASVTTTAVTGAGIGAEIEIISAIHLMTVIIYPLLQGGGLTSIALKDLIYDAVNDRRVRPLSDTVLVADPSAIDYSLTVSITLKRNAPAGVRTLVENKLIDFTNQWDQALGRDIMVNRVKAICMEAGVYDVSIPTLTADILVADNEFANCTAINVTVGAVIDEI